MFYHVSRHKYLTTVLSKIRLFSSSVYGDSRAIALLNLKLNNSCLSGGVIFKSCISSSVRMRKDLENSYFMYPKSTPVCMLDCKDAFNALTEKERLYSHYIAQASWFGSLISFVQTSVESPAIFVIVQKLFSSDSIQNIKKTALNECGFTEDDWTTLLVFCSAFFDNMGNYKGFGDTKIVPELEKAKFWSLVQKSKSYSSDKQLFDKMWTVAEPLMFSLEPKLQRLGFNDKGVNTYHSSNVSESDTNLVNEFMKENKIEAWNTRLFKHLNETGKIYYEIRCASVESADLVAEQEFKGCHYKVTGGDYSCLMGKVVDNLLLAKKFAANEHQSKMLEKYAEHFRCGKIDDHKDASRHWIKDQGPVVESYIGFIENYRDPAGSRSYFEGFVAAVNKKMSEKFGLLVSKSSELLPRLPWGADYEKDVFLKPDFTSLDVICFAGGGIPAGINIPNYDEIRQNEGFKNVSLGNVIAAMPDVKINFISDEDEVLFKKWHKDSFEVQVGLHELLGHGSGKLFERSKDGSFNFDTEKVKDLVTGGKITTWYEEGETWGSKFGQVGSAYEECRAEAVGYFLCCFDDVMKIFGFEGEEAETVRYVNWLSEIRAGLLGLEYYSPEQNKWGQAHCHARFVLFAVALEAGNGFVKLSQVVGEDGKPDLIFKLDRSQINSTGKDCIFAFLKKLQHYKTTGDFTGGKALFDFYGKITDEILQWRNIVIDRRRPRRIFVQPNTICEDNKVTLKEYPVTFEGIIESNMDRFDAKIDCENMVKLIDKDLIHFQTK